MKSYTDIEQSKKLAEILPLESADMHYNVVGDAVIGDYQSGMSSAMSIAKAYKKNPDEFAKNVIPCWSLAALLNVLPQTVRLVGSSKDSYWYCECVNTNNQLYAGFGSADNQVDACVEMILKLNELNLL